MNVPGHIFQALRPVVDSIHGRDVSKKCLGSADVRGGLVPADVLFSGLQRQPEAFVPICVLGHPDHSARHVSNVFALCGKESSMGSAITQRNSKPLARPKGNVHPKLSRWFENCEGHQVGGTDREGPILRCFFDHRSEVLDGSSCVWILEDDTSNVFSREVSLVDVDHLNSNSKRPCSGFHTADGLRVKLV